MSGGVLYDAFNPYFSRPVTCIIVAKRGSGKSVLLSELMNLNRSFFHDVYVFAGSQAVFDDFKPRVPTGRLKMGYSDENMKDVIESAKRTTSIMQSAQLDEKGKPQKFQVALVLDDLGFDKRIFKSVIHLEAWMKLESPRIWVFPDYSSHL